MRGMLGSDELVMRIWGRASPHLRGVVYNRYYGGRWSHDPATKPRPLVRPPGPVLGEGATEIELLQDQPKRYFLPLTRHELAIESGAA